MTISAAALHDAYAAEYDQQVSDYDCYISDLLFGLCYEYIQPGMSLLDAGVGSGLSAQLFAKAGTKIFGMDFSPAMLEICQAKGFAAGLKLHNLQEAPWPYPANRFEVLVCCGVFHFIPELDSIFAETRRILCTNGLFAFTTRESQMPEAYHSGYHQELIGGFEIYSHTTVYLEALLEKYTFTCLKTQKCFVGEDIFTLWIVEKSIKFAYDGHNSNPVTRAG